MATTALPCKLVTQLAFLAGGDVFHRLVADRPTHLTKATPGQIQACKLIQGDYGTNGSIIQWTYSVDGVEQIAKQVLEGIDKEKKTISWRMLEGHLCELYKGLIISLHVETKGDVDYVVWTVAYELIKPENPHPIRLLNFFIEFTTELETHIFG